MGFKPISLEKYIKLHLKSNPSMKEKEVRKALKDALAFYKSGKRCNCGNDIWVIGGAFVGNKCFTCITGEGYPDNDYELKEAITKRLSTQGRRHIDDIPPHKIAGFFDDDGYEVTANDFDKPSLCVICTNNNDPKQELLCNMTRFDQKDAKEFICHAYKKL